MDALQEWDQADPFKHFKDQFHVPTLEGTPQIYLNGNSLGLEPKTAKNYIEAQLARWAQFASKAYFASDKPWLKLSASLQEPIAQIVGARPFEVVVMNSLGVNLHLMLATFYQPSKQRYKILIEEDAFPTDRYIVDSQLKWHGYAADTALITWKRNANTGFYEIEDLSNLLQKEGDQIQLAVLPGVHYLSGEVLDMRAITALLKSYQIVVGWDLAHAVGNIPLHCHQNAIDFAVWCHYKYMNSGPGAVGGCFIHEQHARHTDKFRLAGWWGNSEETRFEMRPESQFADSALGWQISNLSALSVAPLQASLEIFANAGGVDALRHKSIKMMTWLSGALQTQFPKQIRVLTPADPNRRGCQMSLTALEKNNQQVCEKLKQKNIMCDFRNPATIRIAVSPLYNSYSDLGHFIQALQQVIEEDNIYDT